MIWNFHFLVKFHMHQTVELYERYKRAGPLLLFAYSFKLGVLIEIEGELFRSIAGKLDLHGVSGFDVEFVL